MYTQKIVEDVKDAFKDREKNSRMERTAGWLRLARLSNEDLGALREQVANIVTEQAKTLKAPEDLHDLLGILRHYLAWGELFGADFLPLVRPIFMEHFGHIYLAKLGMPWPDSGGWRLDIVAGMFIASHYAMVDISSVLPVWRVAAFARIDECRHSDGDTATTMLTEKAGIDELINSYRPLPGSVNFSQKEDITA